MLNLAVLLTLGAFGVALAMGIVCIVQILRAPKKDKMISWESDMPVFYKRRSK